jgi:hypothetical protein
MTNILNSRALQNIRKLGFLVCKYVYHLLTTMQSCW